MSYTDKTETDPLKSNQDDTLQKARDNINGWVSYWQENSERYRNNFYFTYVDQWDEYDRQKRVRRKKPVLTVDKIKPAVRATIGQLRENTPNVEIRANTDKTNQETVDIYNGIAKWISYKSNAPRVYQKAFEPEYVGGYSAMRICYDYEPGMSFEKQILIKNINPLNAFFDPSATLPDKSDGNFCGFADKMSMREFKLEYPNYNGEPQPLVSNQYDETQKQFWGDDKEVTVCDYWNKEYYNKTIYELSDERVVDDEGLKKAEEEYYKFLEEYEKLIAVGIHAPEPERPMVNRKREIKDYKIIHYRLVFDEILEKSEWPSKYLGVIFVDGFSSEIDGQQKTSGYIETAKDPQRIYNYNQSEIAHAILTSTKAQWIGTTEMVKGYEHLWKDSDNQGFLPYHQTSGGQKPENISPPPFSSQLFQVAEQAASDIQATLGSYEESRGQESNAMSGVAVGKRQLAANITQFVYLDNLESAIESVWRVIVDMIPRVYDTERVINIINESGEIKSIRINEEKAGKIENDISNGELYVNVELGASFEAQKAEALQTAMKLVELLEPDKRAYFADLIASNINLENASEIEERVRNYIVPPQVIADEEGKPYNPPPSPQEQLAEAELQLANEQIATERTKNITELLKTMQAAQDSKLDALTGALKSLSDMIASETKMTPQQIQATQPYVEQASDTAQNLENKFDSQLDDLSNAIDDFKENRQQEEAQAQAEAQAQQRQQT